MKYADEEVAELIAALRAEFKREFAAGEAAEIAERLMLFVTAVHEASHHAEEEDPFPEG